MREPFNRLLLASGLISSLLLVAPSAALAQGYRLSGLISLRDGASMAIIEMPDATQVTVRVGNELADGAVVVAIDDSSLTLELESTRTVLTLKGAARPIEAPANEFLSLDVDSRLIEQWGLLLADASAADDELLAALNESLGIDGRIDSVRTIGGEATAVGSTRVVFNFLQRRMANGEGVKLYLADSPTLEVYLMPPDPGS